MKPTPIFNPSGNDAISDRKAWFGETTNLLSLINVKYPWAIQLYNQMRQNFWIPQKLSIVDDIVDYENLTADERRAFNGILSYLSFLDSVQSTNLPHLKIPLTAPELGMCFSEQISQEVMHGHSYQYMIETIIKPEERESVLYFWRTDEILLKRCEYIANLFQEYIHNPSTENYFYALVADYILEGLYFYNGFIFFYNLAARNLMAGSADIFKLINRDELSHVRLYSKLITEAMETFPFINSALDKVYSLFSDAVDQEIQWTNHIVGDQILGITSQSTEVYTKYLANIRLKAIGLAPLYPEPEFKKSPYKHLESLADVSSEATTKTNFFEGTVTSYNMSTGLEGWDEF